MGLFITYLWAVGANWWPVVTFGGVGVLNVLVSTDLLNKAGLGENARRDLLVLLFMGALVWAGFSAWRQEYIEHEATRSDVRRLEQSLALRGRTPNSSPTSLPKHDAPSHDVTARQETTPKQAAPAVKIEAPVAASASAPLQVAPSPYQPPSPRRLNVDQKRVLIADFADLPISPGQSSKIVYVDNDLETFQLASDIETVLSRAGLHPQFSSQEPDKGQAGVIVLNYESTAKGLADKVAVALRRAGVDAKVIPEKGRSDASITIYVSHLPG